MASANVEPAICLDAASGVPLYVACVGCSERGPGGLAVGAQSGAPVHSSPIGRTASEEMSSVDTRWFRGEDKVETKPKTLKRAIAFSAYCPLSSVFSKKREDKSRERS
jgi:hypothetical protein